MQPIATQLSLGITLRPRSSFENFMSDGNAELLAVLQEVAKGAAPKHFLLCGAPGSGKTHLLEAAVKLAASHGRRPFYVPLGEVDRLGPGLLEDLEQDCDLVCLDDVQKVAGRLEWERALFALQARGSGCSWIASATAAPALTGFSMPELASRLAAGPVYALRELNDDGKRELLARRAHDFGLHLEPAVARYLLTRHARDLGGLMRLLDRIDVESLRCQRRPTIAFIRALES
ncbi:MAG: DnaA regulatory inactivator Hda [Acidiferrobacteraceae bacterium]